MVTDTEGFESGSNVVKINLPIPVITPSILYGEYDNSVYLTWTENPDADFARYELYKSDSADSLGDKIFSTPNVSDLSFTDESILGGNTYYYTLLVANTLNMTARSNVVQMVIPEDSITPSVLSLITKGSTKIVLSWTPNPDADFSRYELYRSYSVDALGDKLTTLTTRNATAYTDDSITEGVIYYYYIVVYNTKELNAKSNILPVETPIDYPTKSNLYGSG